jgi:undecaprenyl-phosphate galactose phosphotransferase/putative colanic acid biosynthesis UDP-glucose lipid carrier transferase
MADSVELDGPVDHLTLRDRRFRLSYDAAEPLVAAGEIFIIILASVAAGGAYHAYAYDRPGNVDVFAGIGIIAALLYVSIAKLWGSYQLATLVAADRCGRRLVSMWLVVMLSLALILFLLKIGSDFSRGTMIAFAVFGLASLLTFRGAVAHYLRAALASQTLAGRRAIVIGERKELAFLRSDDLLNHFGIEEVGRVLLSDLPKDNLSLERGDLAAVDVAIGLARREEAEEMVLALPWSNVRRLDLVRDRLHASPLPVRLLPDHNVNAILRQPVVSTGTSLSVELQRGPLTVAAQIRKRLLDIIAAMAGIAVLSPLLLIAVAAIKLGSPGPVIFRQRRNGFNGRRFTIYKFRTMAVLEDGAEVRQAIRNDPRVTRVGRVLRRTSIDELPQLFNVLKGDMSLVGPRPHALVHDDQYSSLIATYAFRHHVKPGITGWAQVNGCRGETPQVEQMQRRVELDLWYINNCGLWLDLRILARTCVALFRTSAAY